MYVYTPMAMPSQHWFLGPGLTGIIAIIRYMPSVRIQTHLIGQNLHAPGPPQLEMVEREVDQDLLISPLLHVEVEVSEWE